MTVYETAANHLCQHDPILAPIIRQAGSVTIAPHHRYYEALVGSIIGQQLSTKAASSIKKRFLALFKEQSFPTPEAILGIDFETLRSAGLSRAKTAYIKDLAQHILDDTIDFAKLDTLDNNQVIHELTAVKGIGEWTAHMFLIFCMGRTDVLPISDQGIRSGMQKLYKLASLPTPEEMRALALQHEWHPYEAVASWYIWYFLDNKPSI